MPLSIAQLRSVARGEQSLESVKLLEDCSGRIMTLEETASVFALNEAYFGRKPVEKIQKAMDKIYDLVIANPNVNLQNCPEEKALEKAFCDVFGVKSCSIYWSNTPGLGMGMKGPCTWPAARFLNTGDPGLAYGTNANGFYDKNHVMSLYINTNQTLFSEAGLTSAEMTGILLHEVGHNFDHSIWSIIGDFMKFFDIVIDAMTNPINIPKDAASILVAGLGRPVIHIISNADDMIINAIPPIGMIMRMVGRIGFNIMKVLGAILSPITTVVAVPMLLAFTPFAYIRNLYMRKGEVYADSFAASYGYSAELVSGLEKLNVYMYQDKNAENTFLAPFYDLMMLEADIINTLSGGHGSTQQRSLRMADKLDKDLEQSNLNAADKAAIKKEKERLLATYDKFMNCDEQVRGALTKSFREMIDNWYAGKNYMFVPILERNLSYAE